MSALTAPGQSPEVSTRLSQAAKDGGLSSRVHQEEKPSLQCPADSRVPRWWGQLSGPTAREAGRPEPGTSAPGAAGGPAGWGSGSGAAVVASVGPGAEEQRLQERKRGRSGRGSGGGGAGVQGGPPEWASLRPAEVRSRTRDGRATS